VEFARRFFAKKIEAAHREAIDKRRKKQYSFYIDERRSEVLCLEKN
jgi:hypothetical protein